MVSEAAGPDGHRRSRRELLASDADRERTVELLKSAYSEGRLSADEHEERVGRAYASRSYGELADLVADLPPESGGSPPGASPVYQPVPPAYPPAVPLSYSPVPQKRNTGQAVASLLLGRVCLPGGLGGLVAGAGGLSFGLPAFMAVILGHTARAAIRRTGESGESAAVAGAVLGYIGVFIGLVCLLR